MHARSIDLNQTVNITAWRTRGGAFHILACNLEEGLRDDADMTRHATIVLPESWKAAQWTDAWTRMRIDVHRCELKLELGQAKSILLVSVAQS